MKKKTFTKLFFLASVSLVIGAGGLLFLQNPVLAQPKIGDFTNDTLDYANVFMGASGFSTEELTIKKTMYLEYQIGRMIGVSMIALGTIFLLLTLYGGFLWMTAQGNEEQVTKARKIIRNGAIGVFIVLCSYIITLFVSNALLGATQTNPEAEDDRGLWERFTDAVGSWEEWGGNGE